MNDREIVVDPAGFAAAMEALIMDDPYPNGSFEDSPAHWLRRALYAYEWAKRAGLCAGRGSLVRELMGPGTARQAVLRHEAEEANGRWGEGAERVGT